MKYEQIANKTVSELYDLMTSLKKEMLGFRVQKSLSQLESSAVIRKNRRDIARIQTRLNQIINKVAER